MEWLIDIASVVLVACYIEAAIVTIVTRKTVAGTIGAAAGFLCGGFMVLSAIEWIATIVCWVLAIGVALLLLCWIAG